MKDKFFLTCALSFFSGSIANGAIILEFNSSPGPATDLIDANAGQDAEISFDTSVVSGVNLNFTGVSATTDLGNAFTFDVVVAPVGTAMGIVQSTTNRSIVGSSNTPFETGDGLIITISNISDPNIVLDGFTNFGSDFSGTGEGFTIAGVTYLRGTATNGDSDPRRGIILPGGTATVPGLLAGSSVQVDFNGASVGLRGFAVQFTDNTIPEPSAVLLIGLASLGMLGRRRLR